MSTAKEHYREAERLLEEAKSRLAGILYAADIQYARALQEQAKVHVALATVATRSNWLTEPDEAPF